MLANQELASQRKDSLSNCLILALVSNISVRCSLDHTVLMPRRCGCNRRVTDGHGGAHSEIGTHAREPDRGSLIALQYCDRSEKRMSTINVSSKYQIVIPSTIREALGIKPGEKLHAIEYRGRIGLGPVRPTKAARGSLKGIDTNVPRDTDRV